MKNKTCIIKYNKCELRIIDDEIGINGIGYCCIDHSPFYKTKYVCEYAVSQLIGKNALTVMLGFQKGLFHKKSAGKIKMKHSHNMVLMRKKMPGHKIRYENAIKLKKIDRNDIDLYMKLYNTVFKDVPNASFYSYHEVAELFHKNNYDICFVYRNNRMIGFCEYQILPRTAVIEAIGIMEKFRNNGYAHELLHAMYYLMQAEAVKYISLTASDNNIQAIKLYKSEQFKVKKILSHWYKVIL